MMACMKFWFRLAVLSSCVLGAWAQPAAPKTEAPPKQSALDAVLFYQILLGELNARQGSLGSGFSIMLDAARKTQDPALFQRAVDMALQARSGEAALQAAQTWKKEIPSAVEASRYVLQILLALNRVGETGPVLRCVATDGHRLARIDAPLPEGAQGMAGVIVPRKTVNELRKLLDDDEAQIAVSVSETKVRFATPAIQLTSKVIDGTFPDYTRVIPTGNTRRLEVDATEFAKAVDRVATVSSERSRAVKLSLDEDRLVLSVNAPDSGAAEEELAVAYADERLEIGFNAKYLLEIASQVDRENAVFLFNSSGDPTLMREGNDTSAIYVVMPMRV